MRIAQLKQDMEKAHDDYDKQWYNRIIQELCWVKSQQHNCYLDEVNIGRITIHTFLAAKAQEKRKCHTEKVLTVKKEDGHQKQQKKRGKKKMAMQRSNSQAEKLAQALRAAILKKKKRGKK